MILQRPANHRQHDQTKESQFMNAAEQDDQLPLYAKASSPATCTVKSSNVSLTSQHGLNQPDYEKAITYEIIHLLLALLQYRCCIQILSCHPDGPGRTVAKPWRTFAFLGAVVSVLYALPAFSTASKRSHAIQSNSSAPWTQAEFSVGQVLFWTAKVTGQVFVYDNNNHIGTSLQSAVGQELKWFLWEDGDRLQLSYRATGFGTRT